MTKNRMLETFRMFRHTSSEVICLRGKRTHTEELFCFHSLFRQIFCSHSNLRTVTPTYLRVARLRKSSSYGNACYVGLSKICYYWLSEYFKLKDCVTKVTWHLIMHMTFLVDLSRQPRHVRFRCRARKYKFLLAIQTKAVWKCLGNVCT